MPAEHGRALLPALLRPRRELQGHHAPPDPLPQRKAQRIRHRSHDRARGGKVSSTHSGAGDMSKTCPF